MCIGSLVVDAGFSLLLFVENNDVFELFFAFCVRDREHFKFIVQSIFIYFVSISYFMEVSVLQVPFVLQSLFKWRPFLPIFLEKFFNKIFGLRWYLIPWFKWEIWCILDSLSRNFFILFIIKRKHSAQKKVSDDT